MTLPVESTPYRFRTPMNSIIVGASQSGKSTFVRELLRHPNLFDQPIDTIYWHHGIETRDLPTDDSRIQTFSGLPEVETLKHLCERDGLKHRLVIIDDLLTESLANKELLTQLWTRVSHHCNVSLILLSQSLFDIPRVIRNNCHYMILFKALADRLNIVNLGKQLFPGQLDYFMQSFNNATERNFGYIIISAHPREDQSHFRLCTDVFGIPKLYLPKLK